jgi:hypothetical protein
VQKKLVSSDVNSFSNIYPVLEAKLMRRYLSFIEQDVLKLLLFRQNGCLSVVVFIRMYIFN